MHFDSFKLEQFFLRWEFDANAAHPMGMSDVEPYGLTELLALADEECTALWKGLHFGYTEVKGHPLLRREMATLHDNAFSQEQILVFNGAQEGIACIMQALIEEEDEVIVITPCFQSLESVPRALGARVHCLPLQEREGRWQIDMERLRPLLHEKTKALVMNFPNSPSGAILRHDELHEILQLAQRYGFYLISDEVYRGMEHDPDERLPVVASLYEKAVSIHSLTKLYGLAGLRIGWITTRDEELLKRVLNVKLYSTICSSAPSEILSLIALRAKDVLIQKALQLIEKNKKLCQDFLERHPTLFRFIPPRAGCTFLVEVLGQEDPERFYRTLLQEGKILVLPASVYNCPPQYFRLGFGRESFPYSLSHLEAFLQEQGNVHSS